MSKMDRHSARRLERLERVLAGRRERLAQTLERQRARVVAEPRGMLQRYGYPAAFLLASAAVLPSVVGFAFRRRRLLSAAVLNAIGIRKLRKRFESARAESSW